MAETLGRSNARDGEARLTESRADFGRVGGRSAEPGEQPHGLFLAPVPGHLHGPVGIRRQVAGNQVQLDLADRPRALHTKQIAGAVGKVHLGQPFQDGASSWSFAKAFLDVLRGNDSILDGTELFTKMRRPVMISANQTPEYSDVRNAGHDGGDFLFVKKK